MPAGVGHRELTLRTPGGSFGFPDRNADVGYAYVTSQMGTALTGGPRDVALRDALYAAMPASSDALEND